MEDMEETNLVFYVEEIKKIKINIEKNQNLNQCYRDKEYESIKLEE